MSQIQLNKVPNYTTAQQVVDLLASSADKDYIGESISQLEHALQAAHFAAAAGMDKEGILGALLHDIGHLINPSDQKQMGKYGVMDHEAQGAQYLLDLGFSQKIALLVTSHVIAKRYLVTTSDSYYQRLSPASRQTLAYQGGKMNAEELAAFKAQPYFKEILQVRLCDEKAKQLELKRAPLATYLPLIEQHLQEQATVNAQ